MVKNLPAMQETQVQTLGQEDPMEKGMATHSSSLPRKYHGQRGPVGHSPWGHILISAHKDRPCRDNRDGLTRAWPVCSRPLLLPTCPKGPHRTQYTLPFHPAVALHRNPRPGSNPSSAYAND